MYIYIVIVECWYTPELLQYHFINKGMAERFKEKVMSIKGITHAKVQWAGIKILEEKEALDEIEEIISKYNKM